MKTTRPLAREPRKLRDSVHHKLNMYALAARATDLGIVPRSAAGNIPGFVVGAAGMGMLALALPVEAKVVYTPITEWIPAGSTGVGGINLDLNHDGINDFFIQNLWVFFYRTYRFLDAASYPTRSNQSNEMFSTGPQSRPYAAALPAGAMVGQNGNFQHRQGLGMVVGASCKGPWDNVRNRYLGLKFKIGTKTHYGWARFYVDCGPKGFPIVAVLGGYAYETVPNKPIVTGHTKGSDVVKQLPATLGKLALGRK